MIVTSLTAVRGNEASATFERALARGMGGLMVLLGAWHARYRTRRDLARMSDHLLKDIGLTPGDAIHEAAKPFWRV